MTTNEIVKPALPLASYKYIRAVKDVNHLLACSHVCVYANTGKGQIASLKHMHAKNKTKQKKNQTHIETC